MSVDHHLRERLIHREIQVSNMLDGFTADVIGRRARIISQTFNDQPIGSSKPPLTGRVATVRGVSLRGNTFFVYLDGMRCGLQLNDVEFLDDQP